MAPRSNLPHPRSHSRAIRRRRATSQFQQLHDAIEDRIANSGAPATAPEQARLDALAVAAMVGPLVRVYEWDECPVEPVIPAEVAG